MTIHYALTRILPIRLQWVDWLLPCVITMHIPTAICGLRSRGTTIQARSIGIRSICSFATVTDVGMAEGSEPNINIPILFPDIPG